jgi:hypothetical protein
MCMVGRVALNGACSSIVCSFSAGLFECIYLSLILACQS